MVYDISGKVAIITGGAMGIGLEYARQLLNNGLGAVVIADIDDKNGPKNAKELTNTYGANKAAFVKTDVTKADELEDAFKVALSIYGKLDVVINNAGIMNDDSWELQVAINCNAVVQGTLLGIKYMGKNNGGRGGVIVNVASILGLQPFEGCPIYAGTKHFVVGFDRSFGTDYYYNQTGISFLTMCPGVTETPLITEANKHVLKGFPQQQKVLVDGLSALPSQPVENVARGLITMITNGENGSVWVVEGNQPIYEVSIPDRTTIRKD